MAGIFDGKVIPIRIEEEMKKSYLDYAMSVIVGRALPDVRDGLKPVHRRILYAMYEMGNTPDKPHKKSARVVGDVLGRYHPHGDSAVYDAMVRMAQDFASRYPLIDGHGNFGSIDGDAAAAMRYTEVRMSRIAMEMMTDIEKKTVDFMPNYDGTAEEPVVLPARIPNLLINGSSGIAVGMATNIPPHNLGEVIDGIIMMIDNPDITVKELMTAIKGPDFPTGGIILGREGIKQAYQTGKGSIKMRAKAEIESLPGGRSRIVITEIPYMVNKARLVEKIAELVRDKKIEGITDLRDESDRTGLRVVIELRRDVNPNVILNRLYKNTQLQENFGVIMLALVDGEPRVLNLRDILYYYLQHQKEVVTRRTVFDLHKAEERLHIVEGLRVALQNLDAVIKLIRHSKTAEEAKTGLINNFGLTDRQAQAILDMRLQRLTALEREKLEKEYNSLLEKISYLKGLLADESKIMNVIKEELLAIKERYADARRTRIVGEVKDFAEEDLIAEEQVVITISHHGYIKRMPLDTYRSQRRGGRGITAMGTKEEDFVEHIFIATTHHQLLIFTCKGKVYCLKVHEIPEASRTARGTAIVNLLPLTSGEEINAVIPVREFSENLYLFMATANGTVKKTRLDEFTSSRREGIMGITLEEGDRLVGVKLTDGRQEIILGTAQGKAIIFSEEEVRPMGRTAKGVRGISLASGDRVVGMDLAREGADLLVVTASGYGKRTPLSEYRRQSRGGKGIITGRVSGKKGEIAGIKTVTGEDDLILITSEGILIRMAAKDISVMGRSARGVRLIKLGDNDRVTAVARIEAANGEKNKEEE
ncbi:MAG: gyrase subunit [Eubacteriales bacterium]|nr:gyrase subunit [Eubacteriales bacterium]MDN5363570.1 gyrase subunit [Eubacteriales bacterium]